MSQQSIKRTLSSSHFPSYVARPQHPRVPPIFPCRQLELVAENRIHPLGVVRGTETGIPPTLAYRTVGFVIRMSAYKTVNKRADPKRNFGSRLGCNGAAAGHGGGSK